MSLPKLKQIQGGLQLRNDVDILQSLFDNLTASQVATTIEIPENSGHYYNVADVLQLLRNQSDASDVNIANLRTDLTNLEETTFADYIRISGDISVEETTVDEQTVYNYTAEFDDVEKVNELKAQNNTENLTCTIYTFDNKVVTDEHGIPATINLQSGHISSKLFIPDIENESHTQEMTYLPITEDFSFKIFPVGRYALKNMDGNYLLDNDELKALYYQTAIDELTFRLSNNTSILDQVKEMIGNQSVSQAIDAAIAQVTAGYQAADSALNTRIGTLENTVSDNETDIENKFNGLDTRLGTAESKLNTLQADKNTSGSILNSIHEVTDALDLRVQDTEADIETLNGDINTEGSVAKSIKDASDNLNSSISSLANRVTTNEGAINTLNGDNTTEGSVAKAIKDASDSLNSSLETLAGRVTTNEGAINTLNGDNTTEGSVAKSIKDETDPIKSNLDALTARVSTAEGSIESNAADIASNRTDINLNRQDIDAIQASLEGSQTDISNLQDTVNRLDEKEETWDEQSEYTNDTPIVADLGGVKKGDTFDQMPITDVLDKILYPYVQPVINDFNITTTTPTNEVVDYENSTLCFEKGTEITSLQVRLNYSKNSNDITECKLGIKDSTGTTERTIPLSSLTATDVNLFFTVPSLSITKDTELYISLNDGNSLVTKNSTFKLIFVEPAYAGTLDEDTDLTVGADIISDIVKNRSNNVNIDNGDEITVNISAFEDNRIALLLPKSWKSLSSVIDNNGNDVTSAFSSADITISSVEYTLYYTDVISLALSRAVNYTFKLSQDIDFILV